MSNIRVGTISGVNGTDPVTLTKQSAAKAWVNFNGSGTVAIRDSTNVASVTDNASGTYTLNFSNNMANSSYSTTSASRNRATGSNNSYTATSSKRIELWEPASSPALSDTDEIASAIHGELA